MRGWECVCCGAAWFGSRIVIGTDFDFGFTSSIVRLYVLVFPQQPSLLVCGLLTSGAHRPAQPACLLPIVPVPILGPRHSTI